MGTSSTLKRDAAADAAAEEEDEPAPPRAPASPAGSSEGSTAAAAGVKPVELFLAVAAAAGAVARLMAVDPDATGDSIAL